MHLVADENWAVTIAAHREGGASPAFLVGRGLLLVTAWTAATISGNLLGSLVMEPKRWGLDFAFIAVFAALTAVILDMVKTRKHVAVADKGCTGPA
jgi:predicted branched-subunit amino acid permease